jgi:hypothetical protein
MKPARWTTRLVFLFYSRPLFRVWEIFCNHAARLLAHKTRMRSLQCSRAWAAAEPAAHGDSARAGRD